MKPLLTALLSLICFACFAQKKGNPVKDERLIENVKYLTIDDDASSFVKPGLLRFNSVTVKDVRFDTTNIGTWFMLHYAYLTYIGENRKINFKNGIGSFFENCLNQSLNKTIKDTSLICFIRQFHISGKDTFKTANEWNKSIVQLKTDIECYYNINQKLYPAFKFDTTIIDQLNITKNGLDNSFDETFFAEFFKAFCNKVSRTDIKKVIQKTPLEFISLNNKYQQRFNLPILINNNHSKGVYVNFNEFINDKPSITNFTIKKEKLHSITLFDSTGNIINSMKIFGFYDGNQLWISAGNYCFPLLRVNNSFEFYITILNTIKILECLNMEAGKSY